MLVWFCKEIRILGLFRRKVDLVCKYGESFFWFGDGNGVIMFLDNKLESCCCEDGRLEYFVYVDGVVVVFEVSFDVILFMY